MLNVQQVKGSADGSNVDVYYLTVRILDLKSLNRPLNPDQVMKMINYFTKTIPRLDFKLMTLFLSFDWLRARTNHHQSKSPY